MKFVKVKANLGWAFDIRWGHWEYWSANNNPHAEPWRDENDPAVLIVFDSVAEQDKWLAEHESHSMRATTSQGTSVR